MSTLGWNKLSFWLNSSKASAPNTGHKIPCGRVHSMLMFILPRIFPTSTWRCWSGVGMGRMVLLLREGEELRRHLSFTHSSGSRAGPRIQQGAEPCAGVRGGESTDPRMDRKARGAAVWAPKVGDHPQGTPGRAQGEGIFPTFWFLLILDQAERKNHGRFFHVSRRAGHSSYHTKHHKALPFLTLASATARPPPWAPTLQIQPLLPPSHPGMRQDRVSLWGWAGKGGEPITTGLLRRWKGLVRRKISLPDQKERFQCILIVKWFLFFQAMSHLDESQQDFCFLVLLYRGQSLGGRGWTCAEQSPKTHSVLPTPPNTSQATTTTAQDSAQALRRRAGVKNQLLLTVWVKIWSRLWNRGEAKVLFSKKVRTQVAEHLTVTDWAREGWGQSTALAGVGFGMGKTTGWL